MNPRGTKTKEPKQGGLESALPWVLTFAAVALFLLAAAARAENSNDLNAVQKIEIVIKAGCPVDRSHL